MSGTLWTVSYLALWFAVAVLSLAVVALLRQVGVLHARLAPLGTHFAGEGPEVDGPAPGIGLDWGLSALTTVMFTSSTCVICRELKPGIDTLTRQYRDVRFHGVDADADAAVFAAFKVRSTPYVVTVDRDGHVRGRGVANSIEQIEELMRESLLATSGADRSSTQPAGAPQR
jgi:thiol-disulfide isomerase/thioredoxin